MDLGIKKTDVAPPSDRRWLASPPNTDATLDTIGITLDGDEFPAGTFPDGLVPSGTVIGRVTATELGVPYDDAGLDGRETAVGHTLTDVVVAAGRRTTVALVWNGRVKEAFLPANSGIDAAAKADLDHIRYE